MGWGRINNLIEVAEASERRMRGGGRGKGEEGEERERERLEVGERMRIP